jgi:hypothetical protein
MGTDQRLNALIIRKSMLRRGQKIGPKDLASSAAPLGDVTGMTATSSYLFTPIRLVRPG